MSLLELKLPAWMANATCAVESHDPEIFFPTSGKNGDRDTREVRDICRRCPVVTNCLAYAIENNIPHGIWGGVTDIMRRRTRPPGNTPPRQGRITPDAVRQLRIDRENGASYAELSKNYGLTPQGCRAVALGHTWADVS